MCIISVSCCSTCLPARGPIVPSRGSTSKDFRSNVKHLEGKISLRTLEGFAPADGENPPRHTGSDDTPVRVLVPPPRFTGPLALGPHPPPGQTVQGQFFREHPLEALQLGRRSLITNQYVWCGNGHATLRQTKGWAINQQRVHWCHRELELAERSRRICPPAVSRGGYEAYECCG